MPSIKMSPSCATVNSCSRPRLPRFLGARYGFALAALLLGLLQSAPATWAVEVLPEFNYNHSSSDWGGLCASGSRQSPINIVRNEAAAAPHTLSLNYQMSYSYTLTNNGHTIQLKPDTAANDTLIFDSATYNFLQAHAHEVSEHTFDGFFGAMEFHYVHMAAADPTKYLVIAITYHLNTSGEDNPFISAYVNPAPQVEGQNVTVNGTVDLLSQITLAPSVSATAVRAMDAVPGTSAMPGGPLTLYTYQGSLTTPPCAEAVTWLVIDAGQGPAISVAQFQRFLDIMSNTTGGSSINNRPPLPSQGRNVQVFNSTLGLSGNIASPGGNSTSFAVRVHASAFGRVFVCSLLVWGLFLVL